MVFISKFFVSFGPPSGPRELRRWGVYSGRSCECVKSAHQLSVHQHILQKDTKMFHHSVRASPNAQFSFHDRKVGSYSHTAVEVVNEMSRPCRACCLHSRRPLHFLLMEAEIINRLVSEPDSL